MQIRCNVCSTIVTMGDDVARALAKRGGSVPCRNCRASIAVVMPNAGLPASADDASSDEITTTLPLVQPRALPSVQGAAASGARPNATNLVGPAARAPAPKPASRTTGQQPAMAEVAPVSARAAAPNADPVGPRAAPNAPAAGPRPVPARVASPGVAAGVGRNTLPFGPPAVARAPHAASSGAAAPATTARTANVAAAAVAAPSAAPNLPAPRAPMPSVSGAPQRVAPVAAAMSPPSARGPAAAGRHEVAVAAHAADVGADQAAPSPKRAAPPPRSSVTETPENGRTERSSHRPIPPLPGTGPDRLRAWARSQNNAPEPPRVMPRPASRSQAFIENPASADDDDDRPTRRPPPVAELAKSVFDSSKPEADFEEAEPISTEKPTAVQQAPHVVLESLPPDVLQSEYPAALEAVDEELPTLPPTRPEPSDDTDEDDGPTAVAPFAFPEVKAEPASDRPTDRSLVAAARVAVDAEPTPAMAAVRHVADPPPPPRAAPAPPVRAAIAPREPARELAHGAIAIPPSPAVRVMAAPAPAAPASVPPLHGPGSISAVAMPSEYGHGAAMPTRVAPSAPPPAPVLSSEMFLVNARRTQRAKFTNMAALVAALLIVAGAGYLGAMSGKTKATTPDPAPTDETAIAKDETPPPVATALPRRDPAPTPSPVLDPAPPPPARTREVPAEPAPQTRDNTADTPSPRRTKSNDDTTRTRTSNDDTTRTSNDTPRPTRTRTPRPSSDEEGGGNAPPETRLPDSNDAPARPTVDQGALRAAFAEGEAKAKACLGATSPTGTARISVTFAPSGEAVGAIVSGAPFANTLEGQCMIGKFRSLHVPPFTGNEVIVRKSISFL